MVALARAILHDRPPPLAMLRPDVDAGLIAVIERAMAPDVRQRFGSAEEMRAALHGRPVVIPAGAAVAAPQRPPTKLLDVPFPPPAPPSTKRRRQVLAALALLAVLILVPLAFALDSTPRAPTEPVTTSTPSPVPASNTVPPAPPPTGQPPVPPRQGPGKGHGKGHGGDGGG
jgi:hypothetical protein